MIYRIIFFFVILAKRKIIPKPKLIVRRTVLVAPERSCKSFPLKWSDFFSIIMLFTHWKKRRQHPFHYLPLFSVYQTNKQDHHQNFHIRFQFALQWWGLPNDIEEVSIFAIKSGKILIFKMTLHQQPQIIQIKKNIWKKRTFTFPNVP